MMNATPAVEPERARNQDARFQRSSRAQEDRALLIRYHKHGDARAREELVARLLPLARQIARRYQRSSVPFDDLLQVASLALVKAIDRFDPERETAFSSYAVPTMTGELKRYFRDHGWAAHVPRGMQERVMALDAATKRFTRDHGRTPSARELAELLEVDLEQVLDTLQASSAYSSESLESQRFGGGDDGGKTYAEAIGADDEHFELAEYGASLAPALRALPDRERIILHLRFDKDLTQAEIAERLGISQMHVSRLLRRSLEQLRAQVDA